MTDRLDLLIVGAGPAGMAAAVAASAAGRRVTILDDNPAPGGQIWRGFSTAAAGTYPGAKPLVALHRSLRDHTVDIRSRTRVISTPAPRTLRVQDDGGAADYSYQDLILATGARERFLPFPGWTLPGVLGAGGLQALVKSGLSVRDKRVVVAGSGPLLPAVAATLARHGARIQGIFEQAPLDRLARFAFTLAAHPGKILEGLRYRVTTLSAPYRTSSWIVSAHGAEHLESVDVCIGDTSRRLACDYLACGFHLVPNLELPLLLGCTISDNCVAVDANQQSSLPHVYCAGEVTGIGGLEKALCEGEIAALSSAGKSAAHLFERRDRLARFARRLDVTFAPRRELAQLATPDTLVCRCEDVPRGALETCHSWREAKLHTRCGMGPCQGRVCGPATNFLFGWQQESVRPPLAPARVATLAAPPPSQ
ncbi:NAD(P)/FAD-dependent oxidoreductase [Acidobacteria bacterium AB60]|nr:NAD(P)/FAD-dependent oxidoreductase [Acidobacteria bacterium AB60]